MPCKLCDGYNTLVSDSVSCAPRQEDYRDRIQINHFEDRTAVDVHPNTYNIIIYYIMEQNSVGERFTFDFFFSYHFIIVICFSVLVGNNVILYYYTFIIYTYLYIRKNDARTADGPQSSLRCVRII